jgi:serine phosphatase RsbU (regulator of sigma subunit)
MPIETSRKLILTNQLAYLTFFLLLAMNFVFTILADQLKWEMLLSLFSILSILTIPYFNSRGQYKMTAFLLSLLTPLFTLFFSIVSHLPTKEIYLTDFLFPRLLLIGQLVLPLILIESKNKFQLIIAVVINLLCIIGFDMISGFFGKSFDHSRAIVENYKQINYVILFPSLIIIFGFYFLHNINRKYETAILKLNQELNHKNSELIQSNHEIEAQRDRIFEQNKALQEKNEEIEARNEEISEKNTLLEQAKQEIEFIHKNLTDSVMYAEKIQKVILDSDSLPKGYFKDDFIFFKPKSIVSGDFYFYKPHVINGKPCIIVTAADCTGHGVPGGFLSMMSISLLNEVIQKSDIKNAADILNLLREGIKKAMKQTGKETEQKDGLDMALCVYWPEEKRLDFSGARNPLYIVDSEKNETFIKGDRQPIGIHLKEFPFTNYSINLKGNEMIYLFSDGFADQYGGIGKKLLLKFFKQNLIDIADKPSIQQKDAMHSLMNSWMKKDDGTQFEQTDDMVLIGFRIP